MNRTFLVGCSRSGTSVVQSLLACHPSVLSFPESEYFLLLYRKTQRHHLLSVGLATGRERQHLARWLGDIGRSDLASSLPPQPLRFATAARSFTDALDHMAEEAGASIWIEKTPLHVLHTDLIGRYMPQAAVFHLVRDGRDVVASIYDRAVKYGGVFEGQRDVDACVDLWNKCIERTAESIGSQNHYVLTYRGAVSDPLSFARRVGAVLGLTYTSAHLEARGELASKYIQPQETWKGGVGRPIQKQKSKFLTLFSASERRHIESRLRLSDFDSACAVALA